MAGLSLKVLLELQKKGFDRNIASVKSGLNSLKKTVMGITSAFVGGLGLNQLIGHFKQTATELSQVEATLRNVSDSYLDYAANLEFLRSVAQQYGQEQNALVGSFAKFSSAAKGAGMEMAQQQRIFRSLTKAAGAFHLSADQTASVMLAVEQMISKGVVASEELRRQLSNVLPGSFQAMANAAKEANIIATNSQQALMDAMKQGKVVASEVLPYFAQELDKITANAKFDSLVSSVNRLSNAWIQFVKNSQFTTFYQKMTDGLANALDGLGQHFNSIIRTIANLGGSIAAAFAIKKLSKANLAYIDNLKTRYQAAKDEVKKLTGSLDAMDTTLTNLKTGSVQDLTMQFTLAEAKAAGLSQEMRSLAFQEEQIGNSTAIATLKRRDAQKLLNYRILEGKKALLAAGQEADAFGGKLAKSTTVAGRALVGLGGAAKKVVGFLSSMWQVAAISAVLAIINKVVAALKDWYKWKKKINDLENNAVSNAQKLNDDAQSEINQAYAELQIYKDMDGYLLGQQQALDKINGLLGLSNDEMLKLGTKADDVKRKIDAWAEAKEADTVAQQMTDAIQQAATAAVELKRKLSEIENNPDYGKTEEVYNRSYGYITQLTKAAQKLQNQHNKITRELKAQEKAYKDLLAAGAGSSDADFIGPPAPGNLGKGGKTKEQTAVSNALDEYNKKASDLENQYKNGILTSQQYQKELADERYNVLKNIGVYADLEKIVQSLGGTYVDTFNKIKSGAKKAGTGGTATKDPLLEAFETYKAEKKKLDNLFKNGFIDITEFKSKNLEILEDLEGVVGACDNVEEAVGKLGGGWLEYWHTLETGKPALKELVKLLKEKQEQIEKDAEALKDATEKQKEYKEALQDAYKNNRPNQFEDTRKGTFDYKKSDAEKKGDYADMLEDYADKWQKYVDVLEDVQEKYGDLGDAAMEALRDAGAELEKAKDAAKSARAAADLSEIIEDMKELKSELQRGYWDEFTSLTDGFQSVTSSIESCIDAWNQLDEKDADFFDGLKAGFATLEVFLTTLDTINTTLQVFKATQEVFAKYQEANKKKEIAMDVATAVAAKASAAAKTEGAAQSVAASAAEAAAAQGAASAEATKAAAGAASSVASIPYVGPILAVAAIASVVGALLAGFAKFAKGGIVGGNSTTGDKNIIRANSGEAVLTKHMQGNLLRILRDGGTGGQVEFKIKGSDLIGVQKNYDRRLRG